MKEVVYEAHSFFLRLLKGKKFLLDCGHRWTPFHPLSNTAVFLADGQVICHNCYL